MLVLPAHVLRLFRNTMQIAANLTSLNALSPLDGRYARQCAGLRATLSEAGFMAHRVEVEVAWLLALGSAGLDGLAPFSPAARERLQALVADFSEADAERIKAIEAITNHDVKAVEYWIKERLQGDAELQSAAEFIHFACTSEDINNTSHALMLHRVREQTLLPALESIARDLRAQASAHAGQPMLARTHGQPASPTTMGKEFANVVVRLEKAIAAIRAVEPLAKMNGATGNYNAHMAAYPEIDWPAFSKLTVIIFARSIGFTICNTFIPIYWITVLNSTPANGSMALSILFTMGAFITFAGGVMADRFGFIRIMRVAFVVMVPAMFLLTNSTNIWLSTLLLIPVAFSLFAPYSPIVVLGQTYLAKNVGFASGVTMGLSTTIGGFVAPFVGWWADQWGVPSALQILWIVALAGAIFAFIVPKPKVLK